MGHQGVRGYSTYCHVRNAVDVFKNIDSWHKIISGKEVKVKLHDIEDVCTLSELKEGLCGDYFKRYFEKPAKEGAVVLPQIPSGTNKILDTMERWCNDTNDTCDLKGLVVHSFNVSEYFKKLFYDKFDEEKLRKDLSIKDFPSSPIIIVYNPSECVVLLIRTAEEEGLREQIELCSGDMKMFMLLFSDEVKRSRVKVVSLLASNETANENLKCEDCKNCIVSFEILESDELFQNWFHNHAENLNIDSDSIDETNVTASSANLVGCLAAAPYFDNLPTFTNVPNEQMKHLLLILTPAQKKIIYSCDKHLIIQGPYGSGKSIIARKKLQILSDMLKRSKKNEVVHFICHDSKSALLSEIGRTCNVMIHGNKKGEKLSEIVKNIMKVTNIENNSLIVDEYDGENLDKEEALILNGIFEEKFQNTHVLLVPQSMEKDRNYSIKEKSEKEAKNRFDLLKKLKPVHLNLVMRNSIEINNLIWVTQNFLKKQKTTYRHPNPNEYVKELAVSASNSKTKETVKIELTKSDQKKVIDVNKPFSEAVIDKKKPVDKPTCETPEPTGEEISIGYKTSNHVKNEEESEVGNFGLDEAFGFAGIPRARKNDMYQIVNRFRYIESTGIGHSINSCYPNLFEIEYENKEKHSFEKFLALTCIFKQVKIKNTNANKKHVILHFDTSTNEIPKLLLPVLEYLKVNLKVTNNYDDFKYNKSKSILVSNFRLLRGLEHSNITIVIDQDFYSLQHYLVEAMTRCTNKLAIVVLERSKAISKIIAQWKDGLNGQQLIDQWKVEINKGRKKEVGYQKDTKLNMIAVNDSLKNHEEMQNIFDKYGKQSLSWNVTHKAEEIIQKR